MAVNSNWLQRRVNLSGMFTGDNINDLIDTSYSNEEVAYWIDCTVAFVSMKRLELSPISRGEEGAWVV